VLALGWAPEGGWRWADRAEVRPVSDEELVWEGDPGPWLVPVGTAQESKRLAPSHALREFLKLAEADPRPARIAEYASRFGWLGRPQLLEPADGSPRFRGESLRTWLEEMALLGRSHAVLEECDRIDRSDARPDRGRTAAAQVDHLLEVQRRAALRVNLTVSRATRGPVENLIRELRLGVRERLQAYLQGQFSGVLVMGNGPVERFVPATLAATLELELARQAAKSGRPWATCAAPGCENRLAVLRRGAGKTSSTYCSDACRKRVSRARGRTRG